jgi:hypothetical protein
MKVYVEQAYLWSWAQEGYKKAEANHDLNAMNWYNSFLQQISLAHHIKVGTEVVAKAICHCGSCKDCDSECLDYRAAQRVMKALEV